MKPLREAIEAEEQAEHDGLVVVRNATWADYQRQLELRGDGSVPRIAYLEGAIEITSPSRPHERVKSTLGRLVEAWCHDRGIEFSAVGSWTLKDKSVERALEPDECWLFGEDAASSSRTRPDLAIEVVWTSGGLSKLEIYRKLGVREVWFWRKGKITAHVLRGDAYLEAVASEALPGLDLTLLASVLDRPTTSAAVRAFRDALRLG